MVCLQSGTVLNFTMGEVFLSQKKCLAQRLVRSKYHYCLFSLRLENRNPNPVPITKSWNLNSVPCENQVLCRLSTQSPTKSVWNFCLLFDNFLQDWNERPVTDRTGSEKPQCYPDKNNYWVKCFSSQFLHTNYSLRSLWAWKCGLSSRA